MKKQKVRATNPRNRYAESPPDFATLASVYPSFAQYVRFSGKGRASIDWTDYNATRELTRVLLEHDYGIKWWIPDGQLCPTVTNRANYIHWLEDLLHESKKQGHIAGVDIGTGANCIYPLLGASLRGWKFVGTDVTPVALEWAVKNVQQNSHLGELIEIRHAASGDSDARNEVDENGEEDAFVDSSKVLVGVLKEGEEFDFCMCNPPFFESMEQAGLNPRTACGGTKEEMVCSGGEAGFISRLIEDSVQLRTRIRWYTTMVGRKASLKVLTAQLRNSGVTMLKTTEFVQGRTSRWGLAWSFSDPPKVQVPSVVVSGKNNSNVSFMLDGLNRQCNAWDVLQGLAAHLETNGATCQVDTASFTISGTFLSDESVVGKRNRDDVLVQDSGRAVSDLQKFKASVFEQSPGCLLIKGSLLKGESSSSSTSRFSSMLETAEHALKEQFSSRVRQKL